MWSFANIAHRNAIHRVIFLVARIYGQLLGYGKIRLDDVRVRTANLISTIGYIPSASRKFSTFTFERA